MISITGKTEIDLENIGLNFFGVVYLYIHDNYIYMKIYASCHHITKLCHKLYTFIATLRDDVGGLIIIIGESFWFDNFNYVIYMHIMYIIYTSC